MLSCRLLLFVLSMSCLVGETCGETRGWFGGSTGGNDAVSAVIVKELVSLGRGVEKLHADNEKLHADNQKLHAGNQKLRADFTKHVEDANKNAQKLHADNQKLRADSTADNQKLHADNQKLRADFTKHVNRIEKRIDGLCWRRLADGGLGVAPIARRNAPVFCVRAVIGGKLVNCFLPGSGLVGGIVIGGAATMIDWSSWRADKN